MTRTLRLGDTSLVVEHIIAWRVVLDGGTAPETHVWVRHIEQGCFLIEGDHAEAITKAVEARDA